MSIIQNLESLQLHTNNNYCKIKDLPIELLEYIFNYIDRNDSSSMISFTLAIPTLFNIYKKYNPGNRIPVCVKTLSNQPHNILFNLVNMYSLYSVINFCTVNISPFVKTVNGIKFIDYLIKKSYLYNKYIKNKKNKDKDNKDNRNFHINSLSNENLANIGEKIFNTDVDYYIFNRLVTFFEKSTEKYTEKINNSNIFRKIKQLNSIERSVILRYLPNIPNIPNNSNNIKEILLNNTWWYNVIIEALKHNYLKVIDLLIDNLEIGTEMLPANNLCLFIILDYDTLHKPTLTYYLEKIILKIGYYNSIWNIIVSSSLSSDDISKTNRIFEYLIKFNGSNNGISSIIIKGDLTKNGSLFKMILDYYKKNNMQFDLNIVHKNLVYQKHPFTDDNLDSNHTMNERQYLKYVEIIDTSYITDKGLLKEIYKNLLTDSVCCEKCFIKEIHKYKIEKKISESVPMLRLEIDKLQYSIKIHNSYINVFQEKLNNYYLNIFITKEQRILELINIYKYVINCAHFIKSHEYIQLIISIKQSITNNEASISGDNSNYAIELKQIFEKIKKILV